VLVEGFLGDEVLSATGKPQHPHPIIDLFDGRLILELARENIHVIAHAGETLAQLKYENNLTSCVGFPQFRLGADVTVRRDHHDALLD
jgi:hypothetical protein